MPLRRWFSDHGHPGWYSWVVVVGTSLTSAVLCLVVSLHAAKVSVEREREARVAAQAEIGRSQAENKRAACAVIISQDEAYNDPASPPVTAAGKRAGLAWRDLRRAFQCDKE